MPKSKFEFTGKFFHPPQRTVQCNHGLLDTRTKRIVAQDRFIVAENRLLEAERRKSASNLQHLKFEQKQMEKRLSDLHSQLGSSVIDQPDQQSRRRSFRNKTLSVDSYELSRRISLFSENDISEFSFITHDFDSSDEYQIDTHRTIPSQNNTPRSGASSIKPEIKEKEYKQYLLPVVTVIPPD